MKTYFQDLSTEILIKIFEYCDFDDLYELQQTCSRFYQIIKNATGLGSRNPLLITNQVQQEIRNRSIKLLTIRDKFRILTNWKNGVYKERYVLKEKKNCIPWLVLTRDYLWLSKGSNINAYKRRNNALDVQKPCYSVGFPNKSDVCKFVFKQSCLVSGQLDGSIFIWKSENDMVHLQNCHESDVDSVDLEGNIFVSGSKDKNVKVWTIHTEHQQPYEPIYSYDIGDRIWSTALSNGSQYLAVGTAGHNSVPPLHIFDLNRHRILLELGVNFQRGSGILHVKWENPYSLLSCGYDKNVRKWDVRTGVCEQSWEDPFYSTIYCFDTDRCCTLLTGTQSYGRVVLWDMRMKPYVQVYFMETCKKAIFSSPIYSLSFDVCHLFAATDRYLNILDFSVRNGIVRNYSNIFDTVR